MINALTPPNKPRTSAADYRGEQVNSNAEVVFLIDTSGSMGDQIRGIKRSCQKFADHIASTGATLRMGLVGFDIGGHQGFRRDGYTVKNLGKYTIGIWPLADPKEFKQHVKKLRLGLFGGAGCYVAGRGSLRVFKECCRLFSDGKEITKRSLVLISDEMGRTHDLKKIVSTLRAERITAHVLGCTEADYAGKFRPGPHQEIARLTEGAFIPIRGTGGVHDFSKMLDRVAEAIARGLRQRLTTIQNDMGKDSTDGRSRAVVLREVPLQLEPRIRTLAPETVSEMTLAAGEGFDILERFACPHCGDKQREKCPHCSANVCAASGRATGIATCPCCREQYEPVDSDAVYVGADRSVEAKVALLTKSAGKRS